MAKYYEQHYLSFHHMTLQECIDAVKRSIAAAKHDAALDILERYAASASSKDLSEKILMLRQRLASLNEQFLISATITEEEYSAELNLLTKGIIELLKSLQVSEKLPQKGGSLLHNIPSRMRQDKRIKIVVRIAYTDDVAAAGLDKATVTLSKLPRITGLMSVQLMDPFRGFEITPVSDEGQATFYENYTEWQYYIRPLQVGEAVLVVKVSAVEEVNGKQVPFNVVVEQPVMITIEAAPEKEKWVNGGRISLTDSPKEVLASKAAAKQPEQSKAKTIPIKSKKSLPWTAIAGIATAVLVIVLILPIFTSNSPEPVNSDVTKTEVLPPLDSITAQQPTEIVQKTTPNIQPNTQQDTAKVVNKKVAPEDEYPLDAMVPKSAPLEVKTIDTAVQQAPTRSPGGFAKPVDTISKRDTTKNE